jgi:hypothetical protein
LCPRTAIRRGDRIGRPRQPTPFSLPNGFRLWRSKPPPRSSAAACGRGAGRTAGSPPNGGRASWATSRYRGSRSSRWTWNGSAAVPGRGPGRRARSRRCGTDVAGSTGGAARGRGRLRGRRSRRRTGGGQSGELEKRSEPHEGPPENQNRDQTRRQAGATAVGGIANKAGSRRPES